MACFHLIRLSSYQLIKSGGIHLSKYKNLETDVRDSNVHNNINVIQKDLGIHT